MNLDLSPIEIAAVSTAGVALILILIVSIHYTLKRIRRRRSTAQSFRHSPTAESRRRLARSPAVQTPNLTPTRSERERRGTFTTWGFGYPTTAPDDFPPIAPSPSTGQTTLVTPSTGTPGKGRKWFGGKDGKSSKDGKDGKEHDKDARSPVVLRPESEEMVMVTYEEGLAKLGIGRPHHILYPGDPTQVEPPGFEEARQAYPVAGSPRATPGRSGPRPVAEDVGTGGGDSYDQMARLSSADRVREWARSPLNRTGGAGVPASAASTQDSGRTKPGVAGVGAGAGENMMPQSTWLPSYYHTDRPRRREADEESEMEYRGYDNGARTVHSGSLGAERWGRSRI